MFKGKRYLQLQELLDEANERLQQFPELDQAPFTKRTVYYYVQEGLLQRPEGIRRGPRTPYPVDFVDRLLFIRRLQSEEALTLDHIRQVLGETPPETIHRVASGKEEIQTVFMLPAAAPPPVPKSTAPKRSKMKMNKKAEFDAEELEDTELFAAAMADSSMEDTLPDSISDTSAPEPDEQPTQIYEAGSQATLEVQGELNERQRRQLEKATELIKSILDDNENNDKKD